MAIAIDMVYDRNEAIQKIKEDGKDLPLEFGANAYGYGYMYALTYIPTYDEKNNKKIVGIIGIAFEPNMRMHLYQSPKVILKVGDNNKLILDIDGVIFNESDEELKFNGLNQFCIVNKTRSKEFADFAYRNV